MALYVLNWATNIHNAFAEAAAFCQIGWVVFCDVFVNLYVYRDSLCVDWVGGLIFHLVIRIKTDQMSYKNHFSCPH